MMVFGYNTILKAFLIGSVNWRANFYRLENCGVRKHMTEETPTKVVSLLGVALTSMALLFTVSATDASFMGTQQAVPNPFAPEKVVAVIDNVASSYSNYLSANVLQPVGQSYAIAGDNLSWIASNAKDSAVAMLGLDQQSTMVAQVPVQGRVAGAHTVRTASSRTQQPGLFDSLYSVLIQ